MSPGMGKAESSRRIRINRIGASGRRVALAADADERGALAAALGIEAVESLEAELEVQPLVGDAYQVHGTLVATVVQSDVVTLDPVRQNVAEAIDATLVPADGRRRSAQDDADTASAERDVYTNGEIDLWAIVVEHLALSLDPYPRAPGVSFEPHVEDVAGPEDSPFAALAGLKRDPT